MKKAIQYQINTKNEKFRGVWLTHEIVDADKAKFAYEKIIANRPAKAWNFRVVEAKAAERPEKVKEKI